MSGADFLRGLYEAFGKGDIETVLGAMDSGVHWHEAEGNPYMPSGEAWVGPDQVLEQLFSNLGNDWEHFTVKPSAFHDAGDTVTVEGRYSGVFKATGLALDSQFCHVWTLSDGKITKFQQYADTAQLQKVMGA